MHPYFLKVFWRLRVTGVVHAGAHKGEESGTYKKYGFGPAIWIEAIPSLARELEQRFGAPDIVINAALWSKDGENLEFKVTSSSGSSSLFDLDLHRKFYPEITHLETLKVETRTLDTLLADVQVFNLLVLDLQGAEYEALQGGPRTLEKVDYVLCEVNRLELYKGIKRVAELDRLLGLSGFIRVATRWTRHGWGEALYLRQPSNWTKSVWTTYIQMKSVLYYIWLHLVEIPIVAFRNARRESVERSNSY